MTATWYLVKHVADLRRREPRNVGIILRTGDGFWQSKFLGETEDGTVHSRDIPRNYGINYEIYASWRDYFRRKLSDDAWRDVERLQSRRKGNFYTEAGGQIFDDDEVDWPGELQQLYNELVAPPEKKKQEPPLTHIRTAVENIFKRINLSVKRNVEVDAEYDGHFIKVPFRYAYANGFNYLMDILQVHALDPAADARELRSRFEAVKRAGNARSFVSFYASSFIESDRLDDVLLPVEHLSTAVDVDDLDNAAQTIAEATGANGSA